MCYPVLIYSMILRDGLKAWVGIRTYGKIGEVDSLQLLARVDVHATWVSEKVLDIMEPLPRHVDGGEIVRDSDGKATGIFVDNAMTLVPSPPRSEAVMLEYFQRTMKDALSAGLTSIHDAGNDVRVIKFYEDLAEQGQIPVGFNHQLNGIRRRTHTLDTPVHYGYAGRWPSEDAASRKSRQRRAIER